MSGDPADRDFQAWLDGQLDAAAAARVEAEVAASPDLAERARLERSFDARLRRALVADPASADAVRAMAARARTGSRPRARLLRFPSLAVSAAAALLVALTGMWFLCIPPFECAYMLALESASHDAAALPGPNAEERARSLGLPASAGEALAAAPAAATDLDFWFWNFPGVRMDYVCGGGKCYRVAACESEGLRPSFRHEEERDGASWWIADVEGSRVVAFEHPRREVVYAVTGPEGDESVYSFARALRSSIR